MYKPNDPQSLEKYSSAVTLSDMEIFIFPELIYSLTLANIMSPMLWQWHRDPWFSKTDKLNSYRRILRLKQYVMDNYTFNLDLDTWGLTTKEKELARFKGFVDEPALAQSNALFGYEGDKYYFDIEIRKHFGLDKYTSSVIPYWKTETIEAMTAFRLKEGYPTGAGECVSLSTLYAAALFVVAGVPLESLYLMATPLHSQNFIDIKDGIITNNRRIVTKNMWFNGTEASAKARRALQHERVTVVAHNTGYVHVLYPHATISPAYYQRFSTALKSYLKTDIDFGIIANFLRHHSQLQRCFQIAHGCCGKPRYIQAEKVYAYEHNSKSKVGDETQSSLLHEIDEDEFYPEPLGNRIILNDLEAFFKTNRISIDSACNLGELKKQLRHTCFNVEDVVRDLLAFCKIEPRLPAENKQWVSSKPIELDGVKSAEEAVARLEAIRGENDTADLAFTALRDLSRSAWKPFLKAAMERSPVSIAGSRNMDVESVAEVLRSLPDASIYDGSRLAQPDEVWNFGRGDGLEKAVCLMNVARAKHPELALSLDGDRSSVRVKAGANEFVFATQKGLELPTARDWEF